MNTKILTVVVGLLLLVPAGYAANYQFGSCPSGHDCDQVPDDGGEFPPNAVTGHTVYASFVIEKNERDTLGLPTDFAAVAGYFQYKVNATVAVQRECVVWFDGQNLDQRPGTANFDGAGGENAFPSDEDQPGPADQSYQDYDFDRDVENCVPVITPGGYNLTMSFAVVVEEGDCNPASGSEFRFRGHLDFVDPNGVYHEVQEYDYECSDSTPAGNQAGANGLLGTSQIVKDLFPLTGTDRHNEVGCDTYETPADNQDIVGTQDPGFFDLGHKCNGSVQDLFTERMWMTQFHATVIDPTINAPYNFALQIDTCSGMNLYETSGKPALGASNNYTGNTDSPSSPFGFGGTIDGWDATLDSIGFGQPLVEVCHDGSSYSFDDTSRGRVSHDGPNATVEEVMRGNSYNNNNTNTQMFERHRENCRVDWIDWPYNEHPNSADQNDVPDDDCYPEDHKSAQIDIYVYDFDVTGGLWTANTNNLGGLGGGFTAGTPTDENGDPIAP